MIGGRGGLLSAAMTGALLNVPHGEVKKMEYRGQKGPNGNWNDTFVVHFRAPDGETYEHPVANGGYTENNPALQLLALAQTKPSDIDGTSFKPDDLYIPLVCTPDGWAMHQNALDRGKELLTSDNNAMWFGSTAEIVE